MNRIDARILGGILLIVLGLVFTLQNFGIIESGLVWLWVLIFGAGGVAFAYAFMTNREHWWALIPGFSLLGLSALIALAELFPRVGGELGGALFMGAIGLSFWLIYLMNREHWWAVIPGGTLFTISLMILLSLFYDGAGLAGFFFLGLAATFALVAILPTSQKADMKWAFIPAGALAFMGVVISLAAAPRVLGLVAPVALILGGLYLVYRTMRGR